MRFRSLCVCAAVAFCLAPILSASAQLKRVQLVATSGPASVSEGPGFRDPLTGKVWTPDNVGEDGKPLDPSDRAFDPGGQAVVVGKPSEQMPRIQRVGRVPVTAGPTVPLVEIDNLALKVNPGGRWRAVLYLQNNSASMLAVDIACAFTNEGKPVSETILHVPPVASGERLGLSVHGPASESYVDRVACNVMSP